MTKTLGIIEWVDSTKVLKEILEKEYQDEQPKNDLAANNPAYQSRLEFIKKECHRMGIKTTDTEV